MKILIYSRPFYPSIGGLETISQLLAHELFSEGHEVRVLTETASSIPDDFSFPVLRRPSARQWLESIRWADVFLQQGVSLRGIWPLLFVRRPWIVVHHIWLPRLSLLKDPLSWLKRRLIRLANANIAVSKALADDIGVCSIVIGNCYDDHIFSIVESGARHKDIIFVGRLIKEKGCHILLEALDILKQDGLAPVVTIVGSGPELPKLEAKVTELSLSSQVVFAGPQGHTELAGMLSRHRIIVVPSLWAEPFGLVALEGLACGCIVICSQGGGLCEAAGPCGVTFPNGDAVSLADRIRLILLNNINISELMRYAPKHLANHSRARMCQQYIQIFEKIIAGNG